MTGVSQNRALKPNVVPAKRDQNPMIHARGEKVDFVDLLSKGNALARLLEDAGGKEGDLYVLIMDKSVDFLISFFGINRSGGVALPVGPDCSVDRLQTILFEYAPKWLIVDESVAPFLGSETLRNGMLNVGWMGSREKLPDGICPEFIRENINSYLCCKNRFQSHRACYSKVFPTSLPGLRRTANHKGDLLHRLEEEIDCRKPNRMNWKLSRKTKLS